MKYFVPTDEKVYTSDKIEPTSINESNTHPSDQCYKNKR